ncbi:MAG: GspH/FimT family pseudopilin [Burkholderiales bacterium]|jgi:type II secretion system protein H|nr:GspH/FimT family pseudopilin [Burkholderiales bacterium]
MPNTMRRWAVSLTFPRYFSAAFTLVEVLIVLVILSVAVGVAALNLSRDVSKELRVESRELAGALEYATDRARWQHQVLGLAPLEQGIGWQFLVLSDDEKPQWKAVDDDALRVRRLPEGMIYRPMIYSGKATSPETVLPILPSGHFEPYELELCLETVRARILVDPLGRVTLFPPETIE